MNISYHLFRWLHYRNRIKNKSDKIHNFFVKKGMPKTGFESTTSPLGSPSPFPLPLI